jgi:hypothetical protein
MNKDVKKNAGTCTIQVIDANKYRNNEYKKLTIKVNEDFKNKIESNILYVRTVDKGSYDGRVGLNIIREDFNTQGILVSSNTYRTHPIQIFLKPQIPIDDQILLRNYFNFMLEYFRNLLDSEFLTTYKYSNADYTRKYLGLTQTRRLIETFPYIQLDSKRKKELSSFIQNKEFDDISSLLDACKYKSYQP